LKLRIDAERGRTGRYLLTSSQKFAVIRNLSDSLAGRRPASSTRDAFVSACLVGTFPETCVSRVDPAAWDSSYLQTYLERDVRSLHDIGSLRDIHGLLRLLATRCSQQINMSVVACDIGIAVTTVKRWISVLEAS
jgi:predicted AAA+ superfamily ATPase